MIKESSACDVVFRLHHMLVMKFNYFND